MSDPFEFTTGKREAAPHFIAVFGESGSGKTYSSLLLARGLVGPTGKIGIVDTEGKRSLIYAEDPDIGGFLHSDFKEPFSSERFTMAVRAAVKSGIQALVIDSGSHEHEGIGGMLDFADQEERRIGGKGAARSKWIRPKMAHNRFVTTLQSAPLHVIICFRMKRIVNMDTKPATFIVEPVCDRDFPYAFTMSLKLEPETHKATFMKVPKPLHGAVRNGEVITVEHGRLLAGEAIKGEARDMQVSDWITDLEDAATSGTENLKNVWSAIFRNHRERHADKLNKIMADEFPRLKRLAADADEANSFDKPDETLSDYGAPADDNDGD